VTQSYGSTATKVANDCQAAEDPQFLLDRLFLVSLVFSQAQLFSISYFYLVVTIRAKPAKVGDAKLWVYRHKNDQDCQAAENE
jgi:hypothetical protein